MAAKQRKVRQTYTTHTSARLKFALCDPDGRPIVIAHNPGLCLGQYVIMRGGLVLDDDTEESYFASLLRRKYTIRHIETTVMLGNEIVDIKELRRCDNAERRKAKRGAPKASRAKT